MAEALLRHHLAAGGERHGLGDLAVASAGTLGWNGAPATPHVHEVLAELGVVLDGHTSRKLTRAMVDEASLIVPMTRMHAWAIAAHDPEAASRTFLLDELVRLGAQVGSRGGEMLEAWLTELDAARPPDRLCRASEEVADPAGESLEVYRATAARLDRAVRRAVELL